MELSDLWKVVEGQQRFLEKLDSRDRMNKLVVLGVPNANWQGCETDVDKIKHILDASGCNAVEFCCKRIGRNTDDSQIKPILVTLPDGTTRNEIVEKTRPMGNNPIYKDVRIRKDIHPAVRREWGHLYSVYDREKANAKNNEVINFDKQARQITRNGVMIDSWKPRFSDF